ncbi:glycoside hydrolase family 3 [Paenibacillus baekrokdamisoli]|uniref:beta-N-acetylhexosaminidase n=1 Tax=Paenibacillus baekrokdamisoli TaxID=1712516 RepID=A0A3G9J676_9BACL|nr:beta-N-acetylhexosaminidase [Paenibacillus baekrokdamisoli]MBB3068974.1 beta-N-acetylhexosaminidase [Paenibacillus baekrokdamisoli]BBH23795.1 glycoside hydrolase family 3 [Paenibacillus baekrokdamisoli]
MTLRKTGISMLLVTCLLASGCANNGGKATNNTGQPPDTEQNSSGTVQTGDGTEQTTPPGGNKGSSSGNGSGDGTAEKPPVTPVSDTIKKELAAMTLDEKLGEMLIAGIEGNTPNEQTKRMIEKQHVGGIIFYKENVTDPKGVVAYVNQLKTWNQGNAAPLFISVDEEGGRVSRLPGLAALPSGHEVGKVNDRSYAMQIGSFLGEAGSSMGFNMDYAPVLDINSNPNNPVIGDRAYGATAKLVTAMGINVMKGIESTGVIPVVKHFPGHGDTAVDSHLELPIVKKSLKQLQAFEWLPFKEAIKEGADVVMIAHILFPKLDPIYPASLSRTVITDELRGTLGFKGVIITDDLTMGAIAKNYGMDEAAVRTIKAGSDILLVAHGYDNVDNILAALKKSIKSGDITEKRIDESVVRILQLKEKYHLTEGTAVETPNLTNLNAAIRKAIASHK